MLLNNKVENTHNSESGFSLIEALIATMIIGVSFAGVYSITTFSARNLQASADRQSMQLAANQMLEIIESDIDNIDFYNLDFTTCNAPDSADIEDFHAYRYKWCRMINANLGASIAGDVREIIVSNTPDGKLVTIDLEGKNGTPKLVMKRLFND